MVEKELQWSWHKSPGWKRQLVRVRRWHSRLSQLNNREDAEDFLYAFFQNCYHLRDWLLQADFNPQKVQQLFQENHALQLCRDICNLTKHFELTRTPATGREPSLAREYKGPGGGWFEDDSILVILSQGEKHDALKLASECLEAWEAFFEDFK